jgi:thiol-disulfide isomerase/thioredoxin
MGLMPRRLRSPVALLAALLPLAVAATSCTGNQAVDQGVGGSKGYVSGDALLTYVPVGHRHEVRGISGRLLDGQHFDLAQWKGKVVVVNFWGQWCAPCQAEAPALQQVYADNRANGVEFLGIDVKDDPASGRAFERQHHVTYPSIDDPSNLLALRFAGLTPNATPTTLVLDRSGRIAARQSGQILYTQLRDLVAHVLAEPAPAA